MKIHMKACLLLLAIHIIHSLEERKISNCNWIVLLFDLGDPNTKIFSIKFNYEDKYIACGNTKWLAFILWGMGCSEGKINESSDGLDVWMLMCVCGNEFLKSLWERRSASVQYCEWSIDADIHFFAPEHSFQLCAMETTWPVFQNQECLHYSQFRRRNLTLPSRFRYAPPEYPNRYYCSSTRPPFLSLKGPPF